MHLEVVRLPRDQLPRMVFPPQVPASATANGARPSISSPPQSTGTPAATTSQSSFLSQQNTSVYQTQRGASSTTNPTPAPNTCCGVISSLAYADGSTSCQATYDVKLQFSDLLTVLLVTFPQCVQRCSASSLCVAVVYNPLLGVCNLKSALGPSQAGGGLCVIVKRTPAGPAQPLLSTSTATLGSIELTGPSSLPSIVSRIQPQQETSSSLATLVSLSQSFPSRDSASLPQSTGAEGLATSVPVFSSSGRVSNSFNTKLTVPSISLGAFSSSLRDVRSSAAFPTFSLPTITKRISPNGLSLSALSLSPTITRTGQNTLAERTSVVGITSTGMVVPIVPGSTQSNNLTSEIVVNAITTRSLAPVTPNASGQPSTPRTSRASAASASPRTNSLRTTISVPSPGSYSSTSGPEDAGFGRSSPNTVTQFPPVQPPTTSSLLEPWTLTRSKRVTIDATLLVSVDTMRSIVSTKGVSASLSLLQNLRRASSLRKLQYFQVPLFWLQMMSAQEHVPGQVQERVLQVSERSLTSSQSFIVNPSAVSGIDAVGGEGIASQTKSISRASTHSTSRSVIGSGTSATSGAVPLSNTRNAARSTSRSIYESTTSGNTRFNVPDTSPSRILSLSPASSRVTVVNPSGVFGVNTFSDADAASGTTQSSPLVTITRSRSGGLTLTQKDVETGKVNTASGSRSQARTRTGANASPIPPPTSTPGDIDINPGTHGGPVYIPPDWVDPFDGGDGLPDLDEDGNGYESWYDPDDQDDWAIGNGDLERMIAIAAVIGGGRMMRTMPEKEWIGTGEMKTMEALRKMEPAK
ncbi:hypothetical protein BU23DRAFT_633747 [Bimuria novae-zelandiae CBS 107.79]|uniref:Apple domain-containing protein n=1 Tax=Bimuria novae-zelandiae CBS 107.79 TaxID=1447943 RepID=A0A6A5VGN6_9PLEO|nr:hypothetical protein BU23DRAFT_633747 [Bimuria novae-zelandiae CBS 107.79]